MANPLPQDFSAAIEGPGVEGHLNLLDTDRLPVQMVGDIFTKAQDQSILMGLGQQVPVGINETRVWVGDTFPEAGQVGNGNKLADREAAPKPVAGLQYGSPQSFYPIKLAVIVTVSEEYARENVDGLYGQLATKLSGAIARAADLAVFHGKDALRGSDLQGITENGSIVGGKLINSTQVNPHKVNLDLSSGATPDLVDQLLEGYNLVTGDDYYDFTNFAAVPSLRANVVTKRDANGNPVFVPGAFPGSGAEINVNASLGALLGVPVTFGKVVGGKIGQAPGTNVKIIGGDFSQLAWGYADQIRVKVSDSASLDDGTGKMVSLWQTNQLAVLAEATFGWFVNDPEAFVVYETEAPAS